jgi:hypothetical protein
MGPGRNGEVYGIVALVPDGKQLIQMRKALGTDLYRTNEGGPKCKAILGCRGRIVEDACDILRVSVLGNKYLQVRTVNYSL